MPHLLADVQSLNATIFIVNTNGETRLDRAFAKRSIMKTRRQVERVIREIDSVYGKGFFRSTQGWCRTEILDNTLNDRSSAALTGLGFLV